jgi:RND family efflux transporter MFP subunit
MTMPAATKYLLAIVCMASVVAMAQGCHHAAPPPAPVASAPEVTTAKPQRQPLILATTQPGRIEAFEQTPLFAKVAGYVDELSADIGDTVKKGDVLVRLSVPELLDELHQKEALVAQAEAEVKQAESMITASRAAAETAESKIAEADAGLARAKADVERWKSEHDRIKELASKGSVTQKLEEETLNALRSAEAAVQESIARGRSARTSFHESQAKIGTAEADKGAADARHKVSLAAVDRAKTMITYTEIKAPFDGMVTRRTVDTGHFVHPANGPSSTPLMEVAKTDPVRIFVDVPELEAAYVDTGDPVTIRVQAIAADPIKATVTRTSGTLLESNHSLRVEIDVPNPEGLLRPGMYAGVTIELEKVPECLVIPVTAVVRDAGNTLCCVVKDGKIERRAVELGLRSGPLVEVRQGLDEATPVVIKQPEALRDGQEVRIAAAP